MALLVLQVGVPAVTSIADAFVFFDLHCLNSQGLSRYIGEPCVIWRNEVMYREIRCVENRIEYFILSDNGKIERNIEIKSSGTMARYWNDKGIGISITQEEKTNLSSLMSYAKKNADIIGSFRPFYSNTIKYSPYYLNIVSRNTLKRRLVELNRLKYTILNELKIYINLTAKIESTISDFYVNGMKFKIVNERAFFDVDIQSENGYSNFSLLYPIETTDNIFCNKILNIMNVTNKQSLPEVDLNGRYIGLLLTNAVSMLTHETGHLFEADRIRCVTDLFGLMNKKITSDKINIFDFAFEAFGKPVPLRLFIDDEGIVAKNVNMIKCGFVKEMIYDRETAAYFNKIPKGNGRTEIWNKPPIPRMRNTAMMPGSDNLEYMISKIYNGVIICDTEGGHLLFDDTVVIPIKFGYYVKNGRKVGMIKDKVLYGNIYELLNSITHVSNRFKWCTCMYCNKSQMIRTAMGGPDVICTVEIKDKEEKK